MPVVASPFQHIQQQPVNLNSIWDSMGPATAEGAQAETS